jgi:hypothetical protein
MAELVACLLQFPRVSNLNLGIANNFKPNILNVLEVQWLHCYVDNA